MERDYFRFEVCANGVESCLEARLGGADRVELCGGIPEGGTTPSYGEIRQAREYLNRPLSGPATCMHVIVSPWDGNPVTRLHVIVRPRAGNFVYAPLEAERMLADIEVCRKLGADGVVFGCLTREGDVDVPLCKRLLEAARGMSVTFHRAFDRTRNPRQALEDIISLGFDRILTSGQEQTAEQGIALLRELHRQAAGRIILLAGSGVNEGNIRRIQQETGIREFHFSAREAVPEASDLLFGDVVRTTADRVRRIIGQLNF